MTDLQTLFGGIDIYLFDQLLRGRMPLGLTVLDAGCGTGRNLVYFLRNGYRVLGADADAAAVADVRRLAAEFAPATPPDAFRVEPVEPLLRLATETLGGELLDPIRTSVVHRQRSMMTWVVRRRQIA